MVCTTHQFCYSDQIKKNVMGPACSTSWGRGEVYTGFWWENPQGKRPLGKPKRGARWDRNIKIDVKEVGWGGMD